MNVYDFAELMCQLNTLIAKYLSSKKAREFCTVNHGRFLPNDISITIECVLSEQIEQCKKQIVELATKLTDQQEEKPEKKKS